MVNFHWQMNCMRVCLRELSSVRSSSVCLWTTFLVGIPLTFLQMTQHLTLSSQTLQSWRKSCNCESTTSASGFPSGFSLSTQGNQQSWFFVLGEYYLLVCKFSSTRTLYPRSVLKDTWASSFTSVCLGTAISITLYWRPRRSLASSGA